MTDPLINVPVESPTGADSPETPVDDLALFGHRLAEHHHQNPAPQTGPEAAAAGERVSVSAHIPQFIDLLKEAAARLQAQTTHSGELSTGAEWLLDNYYVAMDALREVEKDLPPNFERKLPRLSSGYFRIYDLAWEVILRQKALLDLEQLRHLLQVYQESQPLSTGELWAFPIMLRLGILECLLVAVARLAKLSEAETGSLIPDWDFSKAAASEFSISDQQAIENSIRSLRMIAVYDWRGFFESTSLVESCLNQDPAHIYPGMEFETRDRYRKIVEEIALACGLDELAVARQVVSLAQAVADHEALSNHPSTADGSSPGWDHFQTSVDSHVGYYLLERGRSALERSLGYRRRGGQRLLHALRAHPVLPYLGSIIVLSLIWIGLVLVYIAYTGGWKSPVSFLRLLPIALLALVPGLTIAVDLTNLIVTRLIHPVNLPRMDFSQGLPEDCTTLVVIPAMLSNPTEIVSLLEQLEQHFMRNPDPRLHYALLTDFVDADQEHLPEDDALALRARQGIRKLNEKYARSKPNPDAGDRFVLLHRKRRWNPSENLWMGWERKRGKLHELNRLVINLQDDSVDISDPFPIREGDLSFLPGLRYVITLDSDTILPRDAAREMVATLAHPLNRVLFKNPRHAHPCGEPVESGYTILQPRTELNPVSSGRSYFTRILSGNTGLDLYTRAVSDVYQDLFGEGIYVGKGIYDLRGFERSLENCIPENSLLSHDLFEGIHGRVALATGITLVEDLPSNYLAYIRRQRRWWRGDWQLLPWLLSIRLSVISRWKILDNLRRSLVMPALLLWLALGWLVLPGSPWVWTVSGVLIIAMPALSNFLQSLRRRLAGQPTRQSRSYFNISLLRGLLALVFLPYEALAAVEAIATTLLRLAITRRGMLRWTTSSQVKTLFRDQDTAVFWRQMSISPILAAILAGAEAWLRPASLGWAAPLLVAWFASPLIGVWIDRPRQARQERLDADQVITLRRLARRTWLFFEQFTGPEDHWLPPDHYQESPLGSTAHHTSPTNIGLMLLSTLGAFDLGYIECLTLSTRLQYALESIQNLELYRGHLLNWYDTRNLNSLPPRYVSTVDSGNLAACLLTLHEGCLEVPQYPTIRWEMFEGLLDTIGLLEEFIRGLQGVPSRGVLSDLVSGLNEFTRSIHAVQPYPERWFTVLTGLRGSDQNQRNIPNWNTINRQIARLVSEHGDKFGSDTLQCLRIYNQRVYQQLEAFERLFETLLPWLCAFHQLPALLQDSELAIGLPDSWRELITLLPANATLTEIPGICRQGRQTLTRLMDDLKVQVGQEWEAVRRWIRKLDENLEAAEKSAQTQVNCFADLAQRCEKLFREMDFSFLLDTRRKVFHIGYNVATGSLDVNFYDLLASEARLASLVAIGKGDIPKEHWLYLSRPFTQVDGRKALISWSATMFEYWMPGLLVDHSPGTLLGQSLEAVAQRQIDYGREKKVPWGISESGYYRFDQNQNYQYRAFGVPGLGYKRGLADDLVITPYASFLALPLRPRSVLKNARQLQQLGMLGLYGYYEALDFTPTRLPDEHDSAIVKSYMAHHQGMILLSLVNYLQPRKMIKRFQKDLRVKSVALLLLEQMPKDAPIEQLTAEDLPGLQRTRMRMMSIPWETDPFAPQPLLHCLSNGRYSVVATASGGGYSSWEDIDLTRWRSDPTLENWGTWIYVQDREDQAAWSISLRPSMCSTDEQEAFFNSYVARYQRRDGDLVQSLEVFVDPDNDAEIRLVTITNQGGQARKLSLVSYGEVILASQTDDARHPAFNKLFIESQPLARGNGLLFLRRPRSESDPKVCLAHAVVVEKAEFSAWISESKPPRLESDRARFLGRNRTARLPMGLSPDSSFVETPSLDPIFSIHQDIDLPAHSTATVAFLTVAARSAEGCEDILRQLSTLNAIRTGLERARMLAEVEMNDFDITSVHLKDFHILLSLLLFPAPVLRAEPSRLAANRKGQSGLWPFAISGDYPILLARFKDVNDLSLAQDLLKAHRYWRRRRISIDLVFLDDQEAGYEQPLNNQLHNLIVNSDNASWVNQHGGIFILRASQMNDADRILLDSAARVSLDAACGDLAACLDTTPAIDLKPARLPLLSPQLTPEVELPETPPVERPVRLLYDNGLGGFTPDGREYCIYLPPGQGTPSPWINVIANPQFGFLTSESGMGATWAENSSENRLTPWRNDPVLDEPSEVLYIRDEETGRFWSPTPRPSPSPAPYLVRHGPGYTTYEHQSHGLHQELCLFSPPDEPLKIVQLHLENLWDRVRRITITYYVEWVCGVTRQTSQQYLIPDFDSETQTLLVRNPYSMDFGERMSFVVASRSLHGLTADRTEFLGRHGSIEQPAAMVRIGLSGTVQAGRDLCGALQMHIDLAPGAKETVFFLLGQGKDRADALSCVRRYREHQQVEAAWDANRRRWEDLLGTVQVKTPDASIDLLLNRWLLYQTLACRMWGRTALYQSSGAFGFRDQLQDALALLYAAPELARQHLLLAARHQFGAGDVLHWWHPPAGRGVRTRFSDDLLWLPYGVAEYVRVTGDQSILDEKVPFRHAPLLKPDQIEQYGYYPETDEAYTLFEHCRRALEKGSTAGAHNLPLIGSGDWNDGFNRVGAHGHGESIWLAWFLVATLHRFADLCQQRGLDEPAAGYRLRAADLVQAIDNSAWDGAWYLRAFYDDGQPLGSSQNLECQIDSIAQSWSVIAGGGDAQRAAQAMRAVLDRLVRSKERLALLFTPPFDKTHRDPGYIKGYPPGVRENGGQYTHAALWSAWACFELGWNAEGYDLFQLLNPILHSDTPEKAAQYRVEPYVVAADVYSAPPFTGQGGWTWYTGSAAWMYRLGVEALLGLKKRGDWLELAPHIPSHWPGFHLTYRFSAATYEIQVDNSAHGQGAVQRVMLDNQPLPDKRIPLSPEAGIHHVSVVMG